jgi:hypothetical protein
MLHALWLPEITIRRGQAVGVSVDFKVSCPEPLSAIRKEIWKEL